jgi:hypothetical protein
MSGSGCCLNAGTVMANGGGLIMISGSLGGTGGYWAMGAPALAAAPWSIWSW